GARLPALRDFSRRPVDDSSPLCFNRSMRLKALRHGTAGGSMPKRWTIRPHDPDRIAALERAAGVPAVVAQLLLCRGIEQPQAARQFLDARLADLREPDTLPGARQAAARIGAAGLEKKLIVIPDRYHGWALP